jgi:two-component system NtrC family sensor kinase
MLNLFHSTQAPLLSLAAAAALGHWGTALSLSFAALLTYLGFRERYIIFWLSGWIFFLLSRSADSVRLLAIGNHFHLALANIAFIIALGLFAASALYYTDSRRYLPWLGALGALGAGAALTQAVWFPSSVVLSLCFQAAYHAIAILAAVRLILFAGVRREVGPWLFAFTLLTLRSNSHFTNSVVEGVYEFSSDGLLRLSILLAVLEESRARLRRLEVMNAIAAIAVGASDYSGMMQTAMTELCRLCGSKNAWFQMVEGTDLVTKQQVGLPPRVIDPRIRVPLSASLITPLLSGKEVRQLRIHEIAQPLQDDLASAGIRHLLIVPVVGKSELMGILGFGFVRRRSFTSELLRFLSATANQLGIAGEKLAMLEQVLHTQQQWLSTINSIDDYILVHDAEPRLLRLNTALARRLGRTAEDLTGVPMASVLPNAQEGCPYCRLVPGSSSEITDPCFGGYSLISTSSYVEDHGGKIGTVHIICDRTERRAAEERYRLLFESVQEGVFVSTPEGRLLDCNPAFAHMLGYASRAEIMSVDVGSTLFLDTEQRAAYSVEMERRSQLRNYEVALRRKDGSIVTLLENSFAIRDAQQKIERYQGFLLDITETKRAEEDMKRRNRELNALNAMATIATRTFDLDGILQNTLQRTTELFAQGCDILLFDLETGQLTRTETSRPHWDRAEIRQLIEEELASFLSRAQSEVITEQDLSRLPMPAQRWIVTHGYQSFILVMMYSQRKTLGVFFITSTQPNQFTETDRSLALAIARQLANSVEKVLLYLETARAYDNLRNTQERLLQSEKMSAVGRLISGVAHELNNPLTAILGYAQLLETEPIGPRAQDFVRKLYLQTQRTHRVVQNLLSFSRQRKPIQSQVDLCRVLEDTLNLRDYDLKFNNVAVERDYASPIPFITGDAHQLEQVFLNIINNSVDAIMDTGQSGTLCVKVYQDDARVCLEFHDSGPGLKDPSKIFDPFYTTKEIGKGTGLGLSICYGIVKEHGGDISAFNHVDKGAVFLVKLPIASPQNSAPPQTGN